MITPPARIGLVVGLLGFWCVGCSGNPFGEQLAERLSEPDDPVAEAAVDNAATGEIPAGEPLTEQPPEEPDDPVAETSPPNLPPIPPVMGDPPTPDSAPSPSPNAPTPDVLPLQEASPAQSTTTIQPLNPTPYRLLLLLPAADPAAPAEAVTQALRAAGILFEVETIERLPDQPTSPAPHTPMDPSP